MNQQPPTRRFSGQTYKYLASYPDYPPRKRRLRLHPGYTRFRVVLGVNGDWAVYGLKEGVDEAE